MRQFNQMYVDGAFVTPHGRTIIDLLNPANNEVIGKVTMADEIDTRQAIAAAKKALTSFSQTTKDVRMDYLQRLHDSVSKRMDDLVRATVLEYGAPQDRAESAGAARHGSAKNQAGLRKRERRAGSGRGIAVRARRCRPVATGVDESDRQREASH